VLPASLHNHPAEIPGAVEILCASLRREGKEVVLAYADCGTYGALDELCRRLRVERLAGLHCYDLLAGDAEVAALLEDEPGTYLLTDFLVRSFDRLVARPLGIDRDPDLVEDYFTHYRRIVWLTERPDPSLEHRAREIAAVLRLDLEIRVVGPRRIAKALTELFRRGVA